jgi:hypothetical protein
MYADKPLAQKSVTYGGLMALKGLKPAQHANQTSCGVE